MSSIFLSHNHKDKPFAKLLTAELLARGFHVWLDEAEIRVGDSLISKISSAIQECNYLGVVLSPNSVNSDWVHREVNIALTEEIKGKRVKVLPLLYEPCDIPGFLLEKLYADFTGNFSDGLKELIGRLESDLHGERNKSDRAYEILRQFYQDWVSFEKREELLLSNGALDLIITHFNFKPISNDLFEYLLMSISTNHESIENKHFMNVCRWVGIIGLPITIGIFQKLMRHPDAKVRQGALELLPKIKQNSIICHLFSILKEETNTNVLRSAIACMEDADIEITNDLARNWLNKNNDWLVRSYAARNLHDVISCLLISDGTQFSRTLGSMAQNAGYTLSIVPGPFFPEAIHLDEIVLGFHKLIILVRGEHFDRGGNSDFYSMLCDYVESGGVLFATTSVAWETVYHRKFSSILPFIYIPSAYKENVQISCHATNNKLSKLFFTDEISYTTSYEKLQIRDNNTIVLLATDDGIPIFGYRPFGYGNVFYLNTCQHYCLGEMLSPFQTNKKLEKSFFGVFDWICNEIVGKSYGTSIDT